jgi:hypothetical protein
MVCWTVNVQLQDQRVKSNIFRRRTSSRFYVDEKWTVWCGVVWFGTLYLVLIVTLLCSGNINELQSYCIYFIIISVSNIISVTIYELTVLYHGQSRKNIFGRRMQIFYSTRLLFQVRQMSTCLQLRQPHISIRTGNCRYHQRRSSYKQKSLNLQ